MSQPFQRTADAKPGAVSLHVPRLADFKQTDRRTLISRAVVRDSVRFLDFVVAALSGAIVAMLYVPEQSVLSMNYFLAIVTVPACAVLLMQLFGLYRVADLSRLARQLPRVVLAWSNVFAVSAVVFFLFKAGPDFSRIWMTAWFIAGGIALLTSRIMVANVLSRWTQQGRLFRRAVVFGTGEIANDVLSELEADLSNDLRISGVFDERTERAPDMTLGYPMLGGLDDLLNHARNTRLDVIILAVPMAAEDRLAKIVRTLSQLPVEIKLPAHATPIQFAPETYSRIGNVRMIDLVEKPITAWGGVAKIVFDKFIAALALLALAPVFLATAIAIRWESKGPVFFKQKRYGFNNELIEIFKFRSMYTDLCDQNAAKLVTKDDPRVTGIGRIIRKTSIDELPQLINVLRGELSLVGPRPHAMSAKAGAQLYDEVVDDYFARHKVKPGITGWAQINGWRGETDTPEKIKKRVECDIYYIENWSVLLDLYILIKTPLALFETDNAY
ncbi:MAG: undecaprenyl-phosphate glucose phosphotransferase [Pseudomonadota bacterium]